MACHLCFHPATCPGACLLWNYDEVLQVRAPSLYWMGWYQRAVHTTCFCPMFVLVLLPAAPMSELLLMASARSSPVPVHRRAGQVLQRYPGTVVGTLAGHAHADGFAADEAGIRHRVCKAVLETPPGRECYGIVEVFADAIRINGVDTFASEEWPLAPLGPPTAAAAAAPAGAPAAGEPAGKQVAAVQA